MTTFFTADTHFGHGKVINYCKRPFATADEMDEVLIDNWNMIVKPDDVVYHLGDFMWHGDKRAATSLLNELNGRKHLIVGNHDHRQVRNNSGWVEVDKLIEREIDGVHVTMCHYPLRTWAGIRRGGIHLHGHTHGSIQRENLTYDVGVDVWNFRPVSLQELLMHMPEREVIKCQILNSSTKEA